MIKELYPHQAKMEYETDQAWMYGLRNVLNVLPTGGGKSIIVSKRISSGFNAGLVQAVMAHRNELVSQMSEHIAREGVSHKIIGSQNTITQITKKHRTLFNGQCFISPSAKTAVVGVDTMMARKNDLEKWASQLDRWILDEAHHALQKNKWGKAIAMFKNAHGMGVTATPCRADGNGLSRETDGVFDTMVIGPSMRWLIDNDYLADYELVCPRSDLSVSEEDVSSDGDWSHKTMRKAVKKSPSIIGDTVENYCKYAYGRKAIVFATDVETAGEIAKKFNEWGVRAAALSGKTPATIRDKYTEEFKAGRIQVLVNVDLFDEGFDVPSCDVVIMARPTASLGKYRQMVGRALRYIPGKVALIIDQVSNIVRHGYPDKETIWSLGRAEKRSRGEIDPDAIPLTECDQCSRPYERFRTHCPHCGAEKPLPEPKDRSIKIVEGDLVLLTREELAKMRAKTVLDSAADMAKKVGKATGNGIAAKAAANRQIERITAHKELTEVIAQWAGIETQRGLNDREMQRKFYHIFGMDVCTALDATRPRSEMESLCSAVKKAWRI